MRHTILSPLLKIADFLGLSRAPRIGHDVAAGKFAGFGGEVMSGGRDA